jgi:hypothetical protein
MSLACFSVCVFFSHLSALFILFLTSVFYWTADLLFSSPHFDRLAAQMSTKKRFEGYAALLPTESVLLVKKKKLKKRLSPSHLDVLKSE